MSRRKKLDTGIDRRISRRFPVRLPLWGCTHGKYRTLFAGETINIGSKGILFTADESVPVDRKVELHISWPTAGGKTMELTGVALVVRNARNHVAAKFWQCSLRAKGNGSAVQAAAARG